MKRYLAAFICIAALALGAVPAGADSSLGTLEFDVYRVRGDISGDMSLTDHIWRDDTERGGAQPARPNFFVLADMKVAGVHFEADEDGWRWDGKAQPPSTGKIEKVAGTEISLFPDQSFQIRIGSNQPVEYFERAGEWPGGLIIGPGGMMGRSGLPGRGGPMSSTRPGTMGFRGPGGPMGPAGMMGGGRGRPGEEQTVTTGVKDGVSLVRTASVSPRTKTGGELAAQPPTDAAPLQVRDEHAKRKREIEERLKQIATRLDEAVLAQLEEHVRRLDDDLQKRIQASQEGQDGPDEEEQWEKLQRAAEDRLRAIEQYREVIEEMKRDIDKTGREVQEANESVNRELLKAMGNLTADSTLYDPYRQAMLLHTNARRGARSGGKLFVLRSSDETPGITISGQAERDGDERVVLRDLEFVARTIDKREPIEGIGLNVGRPVFRTGEFSSSVGLKPNRNYGLQLLVEGYGALFVRMRIDTGGGDQAGSR